MYFRKTIFPVFMAVLLISALLTSYAGEKEESPYRFHELTLYAIPSPVEFDWESPASLYKSYVKGFITGLFSPGSYSLGHAFIKLTSPLFEEPLYIGMTSTSRREQQVKVLREKVGLAILGIGLEGRMEGINELEEKLSIHSERNNLAAITYRISDTAVRRILEFLEHFDTPNHLDHTPSAHYGGTFWPLYEDEGAGCTAFGIAMLEIAGVRTEELNDWKVEVKIPMSLIGGELNPGNEVRIRDIRRSNNWYEGSGEENVDYIPFWIYEPNLIYHWIKTHADSPVQGVPDHYTRASCRKVPRLFADLRNAEIPEEPLFSRRADHNPFIMHFLQKNGLNEEHAGNRTDY